MDGGNSEWLTTGEAAKILDRSTQRVRQLVDEGKLSCIRTQTGTRFFNRKDVLAFLETHTRHWPLAGPNAK